MIPEKSRNKCENTYEAYTDMWWPRKWHMLAGKVTSRLRYAIGHFPTVLKVLNPQINNQLRVKKFPIQGIACAHLCTVFI